MRDIFTTTDVDMLLIPQTIAADTAPANGVDLMDCKGVNLDAIVGAAAGTLAVGDYVEIFAEESADDITYTAITDASALIGYVPGAAGLIATLNDDDLASMIYRVGYVGTKRYARLRFGVTGTVSIEVAITANKGYLARSK
jgi:hypothetical protein